MSWPSTVNLHSSPGLLLKLLQVWLRATLTPTVFTARTSLRLIACVPSGLVMRMDRARQASDVSVIVGLGVRDALLLALSDTEKLDDMLHDAVGDLLALRDLLAVFVGDCA